MNFLKSVIILKLKKRNKGCQDFIFNLEPVKSSDFILDLIEF